MMLSLVSEKVLPQSKLAKCSNLWKHESAITCKREVQWVNTEFLDESENWENNLPVLVIDVRLHLKPIIQHWHLLMGIWGDSHT